MAVDALTSKKESGGGGAIKAPLNRSVAAVSPPEGFVLLRRKGPRSGPATEGRSQLPGLSKPERAGALPSSQLQSHAGNEAPPSAWPQQLLLGLGVKG